MNWYIELTLASGLTDKLYCVTRAEARERRNWYLANSQPNRPTSIVKAVVRKVG
jgi:hypothetical protein